MNTRDLSSAEMLTRLFPACEYLHVLDRRIILEDEGMMPGPSSRRLVVCAQLDDDWYDALSSHCTKVFTSPEYLPEALADLTYDEWLTGPELNSLLGISHRPSDVALCDHILYVSMLFGG